MLERVVLSGEVSCVHGPRVRDNERQLKQDRTQRRRTVWTAGDRRDGHTLGWILVSA